MGVSVSLDSHVAQLVMDSPQRLNAATVDDWQQLHDRITELATGPPLRGLVVRGEGKAFSAGADLDMLAELRAMPRADRRAILQMAADMVLALIRFPAPTAAVVDGPCFGGGTSMAMACDRIVCTPRAKFGFVFTGLGLPAGDMLCSWLLSRRLGTRRAWPILESARVLDADEAVRLGLADRIEDGTSTELAASLTWTAGAPLAVRTTKQQILRIERAFDELDRLVEQQVDELTDAVGGAEFGEGLAAIRERRPARFE